jgi:acyl carrier protein
MQDLKERLINSVATVFPDLSAEEISRASSASVANWDSLAILTLVSVIEEEFRVSISPEEFENMISFELILDCLRRKNGNGS